MTASRPGPVWRVDHIGSLLRPAELRRAFASWAAGELSEQALREAQDGAVREVIGQQERVGFPLVTDGEFRRQGFMESFSEVAGWDPWAQFTGPLPPVDDSPAEPRPSETSSDPTIERQFAPTERLRLVRNRPAEEYQFGASIATRPVKVTLITTDRIRSMLDVEGARRVYADEAAFMADVVAVEREIIGGLATAGCTYIQIDGPSYTRFVDPAWQAHIRASGEDPLTSLRESIATDNAVIEGYPGLTFGLHLCRGNPADGGYHRQGAYDDIAELLFTTTRHQRLLLEYDTERAGTFEPLRFLPRDKTAVLGLVSTKIPEVERVDDLKRRIEEAARHAPLEQLAISPQCGFASGIGHRRLTRDQQFRKLEVLLETAEQVWG